MKLNVTTSEGVVTLLTEKDLGTWVCEFTNTQYQTNDPKKIVGEVIENIIRQCDQPVTKVWIMDNCLSIKRGEAVIGVLFKTQFAWRAVPTGQKEGVTFHTAKEAELFCIGQTKPLFYERRSMEVISG